MRILVLGGNGLIGSGVVARLMHDGAVRYRIGIFKAGGEFAAAQGYFVHVYVDRATRRPAEVPASTRCVLEGLRP